MTQIESYKNKVEGQIECIKDVIKDIYDELEIQNAKLPQEKSLANIKDAIKTIIAGIRYEVLKRTEAEDFTNLTNYMMDMGLKINGSYWTANRIYSLTTQTITLPANISRDYYGTYFDADAAGDPDENSLKYKYEISWEINRVVSGGGTSKQTLTPGQEHTLYASSYPGYLVIIGTINNPPAGLLAPSFMYHFVVGSGDGIYSTVEDVLLRQYLFASEYGSSKITSTISFTGDITSANIYSALGKTKLAQESYVRPLTSIKGLDTVVEHWGTTRSTAGLDKITSVTLRSLKHTDLTPVYRFENLTTLDINGTNSSYAFVKLDGIEGKLLKLTTLRLRHNLYITPEQLAKLIVDAGTRKLVALSLYGTSCTYNFETIEIINSMLQASGTSLSLDLYNGIASSLSYSTSQAFISDMNQVFSEGINDTMAIYKDGTQTISLNGRTYTFTMAAHTNSAIRTRWLKDNVAVKIRVSSASYSHFINIYIDKVFRTAGITTPMQFGPNGLDIDNFDSGLIAYLFANNRFTQQSSGYYYLNANVTLNPTANDYSYGIASLRNSHLLSPTYRVSLNTTVNFHLSLAYNDKLPLITVPAPATLSNKAILSTYTYLNMYTYFNYIASSYHFYNTDEDGIKRQNVFKAKLPSHIYVAGELGRIIWGVSSAANLENADGSDLLPENQMVFDNKNGQWWFELGRETAGLKGAETSGELTISYYIQRVEGTGNIVATQTKSITITKDWQGVVAAIRALFCEDARLMF